MSILFRASSVCQLFSGAQSIFTCFGGYWRRSEWRIHLDAEYNGDANNPDISLLNFTSAIVEKVIEHAGTSKSFTGKHIDTSSTHNVGLGVLERIILVITRYYTGKDMGRG
jgi:hypothetical protein